MALVILDTNSGTTRHPGGLLAQTPESKGRKVGTFVEIIDDRENDVEVVADDPGTSTSVGELLARRGWIERTEKSPSRSDEKVRERIDSNLELFCHLFVVHEGYEATFEDWLDVALVDGAVPEKESGWDLDGTAVHLYELSTTWRDAVALGKAQRSMEAVGGDTSVAQIVQRVHEEVEAPISLISEHIHQDQEYTLFRPGTIYQTMFPELADSRHEAWDRSTHFPEIKLTQ